tara:strand:+ start:336 stop:548 length:213 start_codon:yes stop_codon:yes gene_type:complete
MEKLMSVQSKVGCGSAVGFGLDASCVSVLPPTLEHRGRVKDAPSDQGTTNAKFYDQVKDRFGKSAMENRS